MGVLFIMVSVSLSLVSFLTEVFTSDYTILYVNKTHTKVTKVSWVLFLNSLLLNSLLFLLVMLLILWILYEEDYKCNLKNLLNNGSIAVPWTASRKLLLKKELPLYLKELVLMLSVP